MSKYEEISIFSRRLTTTKFDCGQTLRELTEYEDLSLWWFAHFDFLLFLLTLPEDPNSSITKGLKFQSNILKLPGILFTCGNFCFDLLRKTIIRLVLIFEKKGRQSGGKNILFTSSDLNWRLVRDCETGKVRKTDAFFDSLIRQMQEKEGLRLTGTYPFVKYVYPFGNALKSLKILIEKVKSPEINYRPFNLYWSFNIAKKEFAASRHFNKVWKRLAADKRFRSLCSFSSRDIFGLVHRKMKFYFLVLLPYVVKRIEISKQMLEKEQPDLLLLVNEYGIFERALLIAGKKKDIPTVAIQHGNISRYSNGYIFAKDEISQDGGIKSPFCPIPDKTLVFGEYYKDVLTQSSAYPSKSVSVTGSPGFDVLSTIKDMPGKRGVLREYGIDEDKKIILWTTQCLVLSDEENKKNLRTVRSALDKLDDCVLIIKQHQREEEKHTKMIVSCMDLPQKNIVLAPKTANTLDLIRACDVLVTKFSTTATEAIALDKSVMILNLSKEADLMGYVDEGAAVGVYQEQEFEGAIEKLLQHEKELAEKRSRYISRHLFKIDGKATERAAEVIMQMLEAEAKE